MAHQFPRAVGETMNAPATLGDMRMYLCTADTVSWPEAVFWGSTMACIAVMFWAWSRRG